MFSIHGEPYPQRTNCFLKFVLDHVSDCLVVVDAFARS